MLLLFSFTDSFEQLTFPCMGDEETARKVRFQMLTLPRVGDEKKGPFFGKGDVAMRGW